MKWVIAALVAFIASSVLLTTTVVRLKGDLKVSTRQVAKLDKDINDPKTGYVPRLAMCTANLEHVRAEMDAQSSAVEALRAERDEAEAKGRKALQAAQRETEGARRAIARVRGLQPKSADYCTQARELEAFLRGPQA
jgi:hypothetical protein